MGRSLLLCLGYKEFLEVIRRKNKAYTFCRGNHSLYFREGNRGKVFFTGLFQVFGSCFYLFFVF